MFSVQLLDSCSLLCPVESHVLHVQLYIQPNTQGDLYTDFCLVLFCFFLVGTLSLTFQLPQLPQTLVLVCAHQDLLCSTDVERECDDTACRDGLPSLAGHSLALPVVQCLTMIISIFSLVFSLCMAGGYLVLVILS